MNKRKKIKLKKRQMLSSSIKFNCMLKKTKKRLRSRAGESRICPGLVDAFEAR
jgi:hypothetical protein